MATYELWEMRSGNLVGSWETEADALSVIRRAVDRQEAESVASLSLLAEDANGETSVIAEGLPLVERARQLNLPPSQRSA